MPDAIPACFRAAAAPGGRAASASAAASGSGAGTSLATSVYDTRLGLATLSWSRAALGLCLRAVLRVSSSSSAAPSPSPTASDYGDGDEVEYERDGEGDEEETVAVRVRPWLLWRRRGSKRFRVRGGRRVVDVAWDLSRARFPPSSSSSSSPEPCAGYFVAVVVDGEMAVVAGDMAEEAYRRTRARRPPGPAPVLVARREHVAMRDGGGRGHRTCVVVGGKQREISVDLVSRATAQGQREREKERAEVGMSVCVDGDRVLHVRRLRWKFRGTEKVDLGGGDRVLVSWDLHNWLFPGRDTAAPDASAVAAAAALAAAAAEAPPAHAVFVFRFELAGGEEEEEGRGPADAAAKDKEAAGGGWAGYVGRWGRGGGGGDWSESSSNGGGEKRRRKRGQASRLAKAMASSSSSASVASSSASWASGSTVMDWGSPEEAELQSGHGFSLLVYAWKN